MILLNKVVPDSDTFLDVFRKYEDNFKLLYEMIQETGSKVNYEHFELKDFPNKVITLKKKFKKNSNSVELYLDAVRQHPGTFLELSENTIQILGNCDGLKYVDVYYRSEYENNLFDKFSSIISDYYLQDSFSYNNVSRKIEQTSFSVVPFFGILKKIIITPKRKLKNINNGFAIINGSYYSFVNNNPLTVNERIVQRTEDSMIINLYKHSEPSISNILFDEGTLIDLGIEIDGYPATDYKITYILQQITQ